MFDLVITNGQILDGSGNPWFRADLGIREGRIQKIGRLHGQLAAEMVDASGLVVCPGFFDMHSMVEGIIFDTQTNPIKVMQGVTTELIGNCGMSLYPVNPERFDQLVEYWGPNLCGYEVEWKWESFAGFFAEVEKHQPTTNFAGMVGHGPLRIAVMGYYEARKPTPGEMAQMKDVLASAMDQGAFGLSTGLIYPPGMYADTDELIELSRVVAAKGGFYESHIRSETDEVVEAVQELIEIAERAGLPGQVLHHKTAGQKNFGKSQETLRLIEAARDRGVDITCDLYPYTAANVYIAALLPPWVLKGGLEKTIAILKTPENQQRVIHELKTGITGWQNWVSAAGSENVYFAYLKTNKHYEGKSLAKLAASKNVEPEQFLIDVMLEEQGDAFVILDMMSEEDMIRIMKKPYCMFGTDGTPIKEMPHPRLFGTFSRILGKYVRADGVLTLADAIRKMTSLPAQRLGLRDRGMIREGMWADIVVFDPSTIIDRATFSQPKQYPTGIEYVLVNGAIAVRKGQFTGVCAGRTLRRSSPER